MCAATRSQKWRGQVQSADPLTESPPTPDLAENTFLLLSPPVCSDFIRPSRKRTNGASRNLLFMDPSEVPTDVLLSLDPHTWAF